jgi:molybdopterin/thiamine biosynthesis adenylyltransferase
LQPVRPQLKGTFPAFAFDGAVHVQECGEVTTIDDPDGHVRRLFGLLDGSRTIEEVEAAMAAGDPSVPAEDVRRVISQLDEAGFLYDGSPPPASWGEYELERFSRNLGFFEIFSSLGTREHELQDRLRRTKVAVIGVGGVGTHAAYDLAAVGVEDLRLVDFDRVELSNLNRQILYSEADVGRPKVEVAAERVQAFFSRIRVDAVETKVESADDVYELVQDRDIVIGSVDRPKMDVVSWLNEGCVRAGAIWMGGGIDTRRALHFTVAPGVTGCVECWRQAAEEADPVAREITREMRRRQDAGHRFLEDLAAFCPLVAVLTGSFVAEIVRLVTGIVPPVTLGRLLEFRFDDLAAREVARWTRRDDCPVCAGVTAPRERLAATVALA